MENLFKVSSSPHIRSKETTQTVMRDVLIALMPATAAGIYFFGMPALKVILLAVITAVGTEYLIQKYLFKIKPTIYDGSAALTGLLLAFNVTSTAPWYLPVFGSFFAIAIAKQVFGGLGSNFINPALAGRAFLMASWPVEMTNWVTPGWGADAISSPTPLGILKNGLDVALPGLQTVFFGNVGGCIGETSVLALLIGAAYLFYKKVITWHIPLTYIGTLFIISFIATGFNAYMAFYHVFAGGLILGAFFMATDYSSSPINPKGQIIFGIGCGLIAATIRFAGGYPEGVSYSILLMNVATPLIERYTSAKVFGGAKK